MKVLSFNEYRKRVVIDDEYIKLLNKLKKYVFSEVENLPMDEKDNNFYELLNCFDEFMVNFSSDSYLFSFNDIKIYFEYVNNILHNDEIDVYNCLDVIIYSCMIQKSGSEIFKFDFKMIEVVLNMFVQMDVPLKDYYKYLLILLDKDIEDIILSYCMDKRFLVVLFEELEDIGNFNESNDKVIIYIRNVLKRKIDYYYKNKELFEEETPLLEEPITEDGLVIYLEKCLEIFNGDFLYVNFSDSFNDVVLRFKKEFKYIPLNYQQQFYEGVREIISKNENNLFDTVQQIIQFMNVLLWNFDSSDRKIISLDFLNRGRKKRKNENR